MPKQSYYRQHKQDMNQRADGGEHEESQSPEHKQYERNRQEHCNNLR